MSEIARRSGLRQSSVYYYFRDKEQILEEILASVNRVILDELARINADGGPPALRLYRLIRIDVRQICAFPYDINEVSRLSALQEERFQRFWAERRELNLSVEALLREGIAAGRDRGRRPAPRGADPARQRRGDPELAPPGRARSGRSRTTATSPTPSPTSWPTTRWAVC